MASAIHACPICGLRRAVRGDRAGERPCADCRKRIPEPTEREALTDGRWVRRGLVQVWEPIPHCHCGQLLDGPTCETCLRWAEKDARLHAERAQSWANRGAIWDILDARKEREAAA